MYHVSPYYWFLLGNEVDTENEQESFTIFFQKEHRIFI